MPVCGLRRAMGLMLLAGAVGGLGVNAAAQSVADGRDGVGEPKEVVSNGGLMHTLLAAPVLGEPYSAEQEQKTVQVLADGSKVNKGAGHHAVLRDSAGRVRVEQVKVCQCQKVTVMVFVMDPVAHTLTTWSTDGDKVATVFKLPADTPVQHEAPVALTDARGANSRRPQPIITTADLGTETLESMPVKVVKTTTIVPAGRSGNEADITKTHEVWTSDELKLVMKEEWNDPRTGQRTVQLAKFSRGEPNAALFRAPADFKVKDLKQTLQELQQKLADLQAKM
jgi:hypothetical protein